MRNVLWMGLRVSIQCWGVCCVICACSHFGAMVLLKRFRGPKICPYIALHSRGYRHQWGFRLRTFLGLRVAALGCSVFEVRGVKGLGHEGVGYSCR